MLLQDMRRGVRRIKIFAHEVLPRLPQESVFQHISEAAQEGYKWIKNVYAKSAAQSLK